MDSSTEGELGSLAGVGVSAASGNWLGAAVGAVGLGMSIFGGLGAANVAGQQAKVSADEATQELGINDAKQQAMQIQNRRQQIENVRNVQRARAQGLNAATNQGAQFGSGLAGGQAQDQDMGLFNALGNNQALQTGMQINAFNQHISNDKIQMAQLGGTAATDQGIASLGGAVMKAGPIIGQFAQGFGSRSSSGGNYGGSPGASNTGNLY